MFTCRDCSTPFERRSKHGNDPIFCSAKCRSRWHYENDREKANAHARKWRANNRDRVRAAKLRSQYGLDRGLGYFGDDPDTLGAAAEYLRMSIVRGAA